MNAASDCAIGAAVTTGRGAAVVGVGATRGATVTGTVVDGTTMVSGGATTIEEVVVVDSSVDGTTATTRLDSEEDPAVSVAPLVVEPWNMSSTSNGRHASVTMSAIISRRCVGCTVEFRTASFVEQ